MSNITIRVRITRVTVFKCTLFLARVTGLIHKIEDVCQQSAFIRLHGDRR
jgi:hypothetical protein